MNSKKANWLFLSIILTHFAAVIGLTVMSRFFSIPIFLNLLLSELILLLPTGLFLICTKGSIRDKLRLYPVRPTTALMTVAFLYLTLPLSTLLNMLSMTVTDNAVAAVSGELVRTPFPVLLLLMAFYGPACEELTFRGAIYGGYRSDGKRLSAILCSGLLFGLTHMNLNQAAYASVIGILLALLTEATGSLWPPLLYHTLFNAQSVCLLFLLSRIAPEALENAPESAFTGDMLCYGIGAYSVLAVAGGVCAFMTLIWMARNENRLDAFLSLFGRGAAKPRLLTVPLLAACLLCIAYIGLNLWLAG